MRPGWAAVAWLGRVHFFKSAGQLSTTVMDSADCCTCGALDRKRLPSGVTSQAPKSMGPVNNRSGVPNSRTPPLAFTCKPEVEHLYRTLGHQNVPGLEITMRDALAMRGVERIQNLPRQQERRVER